MLFAQMGFISMALLVHFSGCGPPTSTHLLQFILLMEEILHQLRLVVYLMIYSLSSTSLVKFLPSIVYIYLFSGVCCICFFVVKKFRYIRGWYRTCWPVFVDKTQTLNVKYLHQHLGSLRGKPCKSKRNNYTPRKFNMEPENDGFQ